MKALLGIVGGFVLTLAVFASGLAFATWLLAAKPVHQATPAIGVSELWTKDATPVDPATRMLERIPPQQAASTGVDTAKDTDRQTAAGRVIAGAQAAPTAAASQPAQVAPSQPGQADAAAAGQPAPQQQAGLPAAHVEWCSSRYRSYHAQDNSYRSYSGEQRRCVSPYLDAAVAGRAAPAAASTQEASTGSYDTAMDAYATAGGASEEQASVQLSPDHVDSCFSRYRSYRPEDNTYQPYDGGPRRQCE